MDEDFFRQSLDFFCLHCMISSSINKQPQGKLDNLATSCCSIVHDPACTHLPLIPMHHHEE